MNGFGSTGSPTIIRINGDVFRVKYHNVIECTPKEEIEWRDESETPPSSSGDQSVEAIYKDHMEPNEYWYPNSAVVELQRKAYLGGLAASHSSISTEGQEELWLWDSVIEQVLRDPTFLNKGLNEKLKQQFIITKR